MQATLPLILVVDDQLGVRRLIQEVFKEIAYRVNAASNGQEAIASVAAERPDLVLLDMKMPVMDGLEALRVLKAQYPDLPVVLMTAVGDGDRVHEATQAGAITCVPKPFDVFKLRDMVQQFLSEGESQWVR